MLVHLSTHQQIIDSWPFIRELVKSRFRKEVMTNPSYTNNLLTHALLNIKDFQVCLHFFETDFNNPCSLLILDMCYDSLIDKKVCNVPLWLSIRTMSKKEVEIFAKDLMNWIKDSGCNLIRATGESEALMRNEYKILSRMGLIKNVAPIYGWIAEV